ncbi:hypothetical protein DFP72DRAFT_797144 [Ephemerocybe angulata]|uniref:Uncharacterized protein n=1 Tax=Ephemerocybe angulata TaxID=980116 RepID=A0A8H6II53_9AGAR|nr:hypothetical protein DFP72DRAFT_797144 [Tulosesus angulatus]
MHLTYRCCLWFLTRHGVENLRDDTYYVTSFAQAGFTNQFIACLHLIYLGHLTGRVPVIPPIVPAAHISSTAGLIPFSSIFNLTLLRAALRTPVIEWHDGKHIEANASVSLPTTSSDPALDHFGCWSTRPLSANHAGYVENDENALRVDMSFTRVPKHVYFNASNKDDMHTTFYGLSSIITPGHPHAAAAEGRLAIMHPSRLGKKMKPEERMSCFDMLYYVSTGVREFEFEEPWSPAWARVGKFLRFADGLEGVGLAYVRKAFGLENGEAIPPLITVHIRRGDFGGNCRPGEKPPCFLPLSAYKDSVEDVRKEIFEKHKIEVDHVLVASNEDDPDFWKTIDSYGWKYFNHTSSRTVETYGEWHPLLLDKVALSLGVGFVGTMPSTFSVYNARRVEDWNDGVTRLLNYWSYKPPVNTT